MILILLIAIPLAGGLLSWVLARWNAGLTRWVSLLTITADLALIAGLWAMYYVSPGPPNQGRWLLEINMLWIPQLGINFHLAADSLSLILVTLTAFLG